MKICPFSNWRLRRRNGGISLKTFTLLLNKGDNCNSEESESDFRRVSVLALSIFVGLDEFSQRYAVMYPLSHGLRELVGFAISCKRFQLANTLVVVCGLSRFSSYCDQFVIIEWPSNNIKRSTKYDRAFVPNLSAEVFIDFNFDSGLESEKLFLLSMKFYRMIQITVDTCVGRRVDFYRRLNYTEIKENNNDEGGVVPCSRGPVVGMLIKNGKYILRHGGNQELLTLGNFFHDISNLADVLPAVTFNVGGDNLGGHILNNVILKLYDY